MRSALYPSADNPLVSVILCTYNGASYLPEQLDSVLGQSYPNLEILISDDASTDSTPALLERYAAADHRIRLYHQPVNAGFTANFNKAALLATGDWLAFCDQDDIWHADKISRLLTGCRPGSPLVYCNSIRFSDAPSWAVKSDPHYRRFSGRDSRKLAIFNTISGHALMIRKELAPLVFPVEKGIMYDWLAGVTAAANGGVSYVPEILVLQRVHGSNATVGGGHEKSSGAFGRQFWEMVAGHLARFAGVTGLTEKEKQFFITLAKHWAARENRRFCWPLFLFLLRHQRTIFWHKRKPLAFFSRIKHCYRLSKKAGS